MHCVRYRTVNGGAGRKSRFTLSRKKNKKAGIAPGLLLLLVFSLVFIDVIASITAVSI